MRNFAWKSAWQRMSLLFISLGIWSADLPALRSQPPGPAPTQPQVARSYVRKTQFSLPLDIDAQTRANISEIHLYVHNNANGKWVLLAKSPANQAGFDFDSQREGEFWFTLTLIDLHKHKVPENPEQSQYKMAVVVDTTPPMADAQYVGTANEGYVIEIDVRDTYLDPQKTTVEFQLLNDSWRHAAPIAPGSNRYGIPKELAINGMIKIIAADLAKNVTRKEIELPALKSAAQQYRAIMTGISSSSPVGNPIVLAPDPPRAVPNSVQPPMISISPPTLDIQSTPPTPMPAGPVPQSPMTSVKPAMYPGPMPTRSAQGNRLPAVTGVLVLDVSDKVASAEAAAIFPKAPNLPDVQPPQRFVPPSATAPVQDQTDIRDRINQISEGESNSDIRTAGAINRQNSVVTASANGAPAPVSPPLRLVNQRQVMLDYRVDQVGDSGVGKVEVWFTADDSQSWKKLCEDSERKSPVMIELPGQGRFGVTIVVSNGRGFGGTPPNPGDTPDTWIEVDMTRPVVEIKGIRSGNADDPGTVHVTWSAYDRNLAPDGVDLYYTTNRETNWSPIAKGLRNDGHYRWAPPASVGSHVFIRLVARDLANNTTVVETAQPFAVDDMSRPRGRLIGIVPVSGDLRPEPSDR